MSVIQRYSIESVDPYDIQVSDNGLFVFHEDAADKIAAMLSILVKSREVAMWHIGDGDDCGKLARDVIAEIDALLLENPA